jgi:RNA ligase (TIGR02306 family)
MSDFHCEVVEVKNVGRHPNADTLSIADANGQPVIFRTGDFKEGDLAVYVPVDSIVPDTEEWAFLGGHRRIRAKRLRGVFSMGLLTAIREGMTLGQDVQEAMGIEKYEPEIHAGHGKGGKVLPGDSEPDPGFLPEYTDIEGWRRWQRVLEPGEEVVLTEKIHGANARFVYRDGRLWVGSRTQIKRKPGTVDASQWFAVFTTQRQGEADRAGKAGPFGNQTNAEKFVENLREATTVLSAEVRPAIADDYEPSSWWQVALKLDLENRLAAHIHGIAIYGEIYGQVQDLKYGLNSIELVLFDALDTNTRQYLDYDLFKDVASALELPTVPELYRGPWSTDLLALAEGPTTLGGGHTREGFVVRPVKERWHAGFPNDQGHLRGGLGRVILKHVGEAYLCRKGG